ncbi:hypothetical protein ELZ20_15630 [Brucella abortus]|nr:hypothetical protein ELZ20_15630 [Brucella abortus]
MVARKIPDEELELDVQAYYDHEGNRSEAARARGLKRQTYLDRLKMAQSRFGVTLGKVADAASRRPAARAGGCRSAAISGGTS